MRETSKGTGVSVLGMQGGDLRELINFFKRCDNWFLHL